MGVDNRGDVVDTPPSASRRSTPLNGRLPALDLKDYAIYVKSIQTAEQRNKTAEPKNRKTEEPMN